MSLDKAVELVLPHLKARGVTMSVGELLAEFEGEGCFLVGAFKAQFQECGAAFC